MLRKQEMQELIVNRTQSEGVRKTMDERNNNVPVNGNKSSMIPGVPVGKCTLCMESVLMISLLNLSLQIHQVQVFIIIKSLHHGAEEANISLSKSILEFSMVKIHFLQKLLKK